MAKKANDAGAEEEAQVPSFEDALAELQRIVADLEDGALGLEESMRRFEQGIGLLRTCYRVLEQAEQKIEILTGTDADGNPLTAPFDASATFDQQSAGGRSQPRRTAGRRKTSAAKQTRGGARQSSAPSDQGDEADAPAEEEDEPGSTLFR